jgi:hypothetical protein
MKPYLLSPLSLPVPKTGFYTYELIDPISMEPFYVGKGKGMRCFEHMNKTLLRHHSHKTHVIKQILTKGLQVIVSIVLASITQKECLEHEATLIQKYGRRINGGSLTNILEGGLHSGSVPMSDERREQQRQRWLGDANPTKGRKRTLDEVAAISLTRKLRIDSGEIVPTKHTAEHRQRLRENNPGGKATAIPVHQIDVDGNVVKTWNSSRDAAQTCGNISNITRATKQHKGRIVNGCYWRAVGDPDVVDGKLINIQALNAARTIRSNAKNYVIIQRDDTGKEVEWENMLIAMQHTGIHNSGISAATKTGKKYGGYFWERRRRA